MKQPHIWHCGLAARQLRARLWRQDELLQEKIHIQKLDDYTKNEFVLVLERVGFNDITDLW